MCPGPRCVSHGSHGVGGMCPGPRCVSHGSHGVGG
jgi:hypothetical protein